MHKKYEAFKGDEIIVPTQHIIDVYECFGYLLKANLVKGDSSVLELFKESQSILKGAFDE